MSTQNDAAEQWMFARGTNPNARGNTGCRVCDCTIYRHQDAHGEFLDGCKCGHIDLAHNGLT